MARVVEVIHGWLGWCPNHRVTAPPPVKMGTGIYIIALICVLVTLATALLMLTPASHEVSVWAFRMDDTGLKHFAARLPAAEDSTGKLSFSTSGSATPALPPGKYWLVIEHPGKDGSFLLGLDGEKVNMRSPDSGNGGMMIFRISGPGSLQQEDAYQALMAAFTMNGPPGNSGTATEREYIVEK